ncbi:MAG: asparaginase [Firmicutes bacterium]|nr:asparaginase [Bacillota bacterium]
MSEILLTMSRGAIAENLIRGHVAVIGKNNKLIAHAGDPDYYTYMRSTAKPLQASAALECGAIDHFALSEDELAIMCSSHMGEEYHVKVLESILQKIGLTEDALTLGADLSLSEEIRLQRLIAHIPPRKLFHNCSGKHCCMLAVCRYKGWPYDAYQLPDHPVQQLILDTVSSYTEMKKEDITIGVDGCGVPVFAMPLRHMAIGYHNLISPDKLPEKRQQAAGRLVQAMTAHPELVSGNGTFTTELMRATGGRILAKLGADGVYCAAVLDRDITVSFKIEDGNGQFLGPVMLSILDQLAALSAKERELLAPFAAMDIHNCRGEKVGETKAVFSLVKDRI